MTLQKHPGPSPRIHVGDERLTLIDGLTFAVSAANGEFSQPSFGLIADDIRHLSMARLEIRGETPLHLGVSRGEPREARIHGYLTDGGHPDPAVEIIRRRTVASQSMVDMISVHNWGVGAITLAVSIDVDADFADIFQLRRPGEVPAVGSIERRIDGGGVVLSRERRSTTIAFSPEPRRLTTRRAEWSLAIGPGDATDVGFAVTAGVPSVRWAPAGEYRSRRRSRKPLRVRTEPRTLEAACHQAFDDFTALTMRDPRDPRRRVIAAGIPWFVALFGRDSLLASYQLRLAEPGQLLSTLRSLAARQGQVNDPGNEEQPGKILHEVRFTENDWLGSGTTGGSRRYFGTIDATPLFLIMLDVARRWGASRPDIASLVSSARAALEWLRTWGDPDGDGFIEYAPSGVRTLANQGWKDSSDAIQFADGTLADGPIALVEVQAYSVRARRALADTLCWLGRDEEGEDLRAEADDLAERVRRAFWTQPDDGPGFFAMALDGEKRRLDSVASNMGHVLWTGTASVEQARDVARTLAHRSMFSGWGVRTLSSTARGYNPLGYHIGSVWPHDTALAVEGLLAYGCDAEGLEIADGLIAAMAAFDGQLPELFGGHDRRVEAAPVPYPTACRPQAWAAGVPLALTASLLGIRPVPDTGTVALSPRLPSSIERLAVEGIPLADGQLSLEIEAGHTEITDAPAGVTIELLPGP